MGQYDTIAIYKNKKADKPLAVLKNGEYLRDYLENENEKKSFHNHDAQSNNSALLIATPNYG